MTADNKTNRGVMTRMFGVALIIVGVLDSMLAWRGGFAISDVFVLFIAAGVFLYFIGAIQRRSSS